MLYELAGLMYELYDSKRIGLPSSLFLMPPFRFGQFAVHR